MNGWMIAFWLTATIGVLIVAAVALAAGFVLGRINKSREDAPRLRRGRIDGQILTNLLPHDGPYDTSMRREVQRHAS